MYPFLPVSAVFCVTILQYFRNNSTAASADTLTLFVRAPVCCHMHQRLCQCGLSDAVRTGPVCCHMHQRLCQCGLSDAVRTGPVCCHMHQRLCQCGLSDAVRTGPVCCHMHQRLWRTLKNPAHCQPCHAIYYLSTHEISAHTGRRGGEIDSHTRDSNPSQCCA